MKNRSLQLPDRVNRFIAARKEPGDVSAALIYGSYARGTQHEQSDVDIIFVVDNGFKSELVKHEGLEFEVLEATKNSIFAHWHSNWDEDRHWYLWKDAKVAYDRNGEGAEIVKYALSLVGERLPWPREQREGRRLVMLSRIQRIEYLSQTDPGTAAILLGEFVRTLTENWFKIRGQFIPSSKEFLATFADDCPKFGSLLKDFYLNSTDLKTRFILVESMLRIVFR